MAKKKDDFIAEHGGYVWIYRCIRDDPIYRTKPFSKGQAWVDLLILANHKTVETISGAEIVRYHRGTVCRSMQWLAEEWGWDRRKVKRFLMALENDGRLSVEVLKGGTTNGCVIRIENYNKFQRQLMGDGTTDGTTHGTSDGTSDGTQTIMNKNDKKENVVPMPEELRTKINKAIKSI